MASPTAAQPGRSFQRRDQVDLNFEPVRKAGARDRRSGGSVLTKERFEYRIHHGKVGEIPKEDPYLKNIGQRRADIAQDRGQIRDRLPGLLLHPFSQLAGVGIDSSLAGAVGKAPVNDDV
jgi:hypothetical protein